MFWLFFARSLFVFKKCKYYEPYREPEEEEESSTHHIHIHIPTHAPNRDIVELQCTDEPEERPEKLEKNLCAASGTEYGEGSWQRPYIKGVKAAFVCCMQKV